MEFKKFGSIDQFRNVIKQVHANSKYHGVPIPTLKFVGTTKIHGSNACVSYDVITQEFQYQSRERVLTLQQDNAGFMMSMMNNHEIKDFITALIDTYKAESTVYVYGEWAGAGIQKGVAVSQLPKSFYIFKVVIDDNIINLENHKNLGCKTIYNIFDFGKWEIEIDFNRPDLVQNQLVEWTIAVENECPVGKYFGISGIGEGIVFYNSQYDLVYKCKGEKHSATKVKTIKQIASVDIELLNSMLEFVDMACSDNRLNQGLEKLKENNLDSTDNKNIGEYIKWVCNDIFREEQDTIVANQYQPKKLGNIVAQKARQFYLNQPV